MCYTSNLAGPKAYNIIHVNMLNILHNRVHEVRVKDMCVPLLCAWVEKVAHPQIHICIGLEFRGGGVAISGPLV